ncbi:MAG: cysteine desulfurase, partial [Flavobacteriales bacterium]|nr:cysteine desulfurase [Flavobacteriales bacterium]
MKVYLDNAATTPVATEVVDVMIPVLREQFGNPSSTHGFGRKTRALIEVSRRNIAKMLNASPGEIFFTSGGTEADNMAIKGAIISLGIKHVITSTIEHHAVGHTLESYEKEGKIKLSYVKLLPDGHIDLVDLERLLRENERTFVSLMHANNEIGNLLKLKEVGELCEEHDAVFHSDTVQTMGHYPMDLQELKVHFVTAAAHKFHGPKGIGFLYIDSKLKIDPFIFGGTQERNMRGGTENVYGIVGIAKALEMALTDTDEHIEHVQGIKTYMIEQLRDNVQDISFHGDFEGRSLYTVLNVCFPESDKSEMLLFNLDI